MALFHNSAITGASGNQGGGAGGYTISRSLRFNSADSAYLSRTPASAGNRKTWTWAGWVKRSQLGTTQYFFSAGDANPWAVIGFNSDDTLQIVLDAGTSDTGIITSAVHRDASAWYHVVASLDTTQSTSANRIKLYVNGAEITVGTFNYPAQDSTWKVNSVILHSVGARQNGLQSFNGYLADIHFIDGQALTPTSFGEFSATTGVWMPKAYTGTYGTNGFRLDFSDNSAATATTLGKDAAGSNNWTPNNLSVQSTDNYSYSFDGLNDSASVADNAALRMGTGNFTIEFWLRLNAHSGFQTIFDKGYNGTGGILLQTNLNSGNMAVYLNGATLFNTSGTPATNTWYHYALVRSGTTVTMYRNGSSVGSGTSSADFNGTSTLYFGGSPGGGGYYTNGYIYNLRIVKGTAVYTSAFTPPTSPLTAITNTSLLTAQSSTFKDNSANNFTVTANNGAVVSTTVALGVGGLSSSDSLVDVPVNGTQADTGAGGEVRGNYAVLNPLSLSGTLSNGNLDLSTTTVNAQPSTFFFSSGKWYWETTISSNGGSDAYIRAGVCNQAGVGQSLGATANGWCFLGDGRVYYNGSASSYGVAITTGDVLNVALDIDAGKLWYGKNGTWMASGNPATGANPSQTFTAGTVLSPAYAAGGGTVVFNFNAGARPFAYTAPSGFKALCTANLPAPTITQPSTVMDVKLWTGNGGTGTGTISGFSFSPDFVWTKLRSLNVSHLLYDSVRGPSTSSSSKALNSNNTEREGNVNDDSVYGYLSSFNSDGFSYVGGSTPAYFSYSGGSYVAWAWDAGSSTVTNTQGSISSQVRANASAGFSVVTYASNTSGSATSATIGHGLGVAPSMIIVKSRNFADSWYVYHSSVGNTQFLELNATVAAATLSTMWNNTNPTSTVFSTTYLNQQSRTFVAYCFAPVAGYSAFGSYTGNGSTDGPFVYTGFRPRWLLVKRSSLAGSDWNVIDGARDTYNPVIQDLAPNNSSAEDSYLDNRDFLSNGFKIRSNQGIVNTSGETYIYFAVAESPFQYARAR